VGRIRAAIAASAAAALAGATLTAPAAAGKRESSAHTAARHDLTTQYQLVQCPGSIHAGFDSTERRHGAGFGRYHSISCDRARQIVSLVDNSSGPFPPGYGWQTPHGLPSTYPTVFHRLLLAAYLSPDGFQGSASNPGVAVVIFVPDHPIMLGSGPAGSGLGTVRPRRIWLGGDSSTVFRNLHWSGWDSPVARAKGQSTYTPPYTQTVPARVTASRPGYCGVTRAYTHVRVSYLVAGRWVGTHTDDACLS
jgi:hypothetical protein